MDAKLAFAQIATDTWMVIALGLIVLMFGLKRSPVALRLSMTDIYRDCAYVDDLVRAIRLLIDAVPVRPLSKAKIKQGESLSPLTPFLIGHISNSDEVRLLDCVDAIKLCLGKKAGRDYMPMQMSGASVK